MEKWLVAVVFFFIFLGINGQVRIYNTEDEKMVEKYDCVYYVPNYGEEIPYCRRSGQIEAVDRQGNQCENGAEQKFFQDLLKQEINPLIVLKWSSSVEMADLYANVFYNRSLINDNEDQFVCNCTMLGTFGKYCEYQLTHRAKSFSKAIEAQFNEKKTGDSWNTQRYGKILCYETLPCNWSPLCLDWREICDGVQRCSNGIDEANCDKLEFNECEDDEFRCLNGMCIAEEFWLDGNFDCMDWSDELSIIPAKSCPFNPNSLMCDERLCHIKEYSCGDGECVPWRTRMAFQRHGEAQNDCFNKRNLNYMCEVSPHRLAWTRKSGLCWPDEGYDDPRYPPWDIFYHSNLNNSIKCEYLFRCALSKGFEYDCPCNHQNCTQMMIDVCQDPYHTIVYPPQRLINPNIFIFYNYSNSMENPSPANLYFNYGVRCRGYFFSPEYPIGFDVHDIRLVSTPFLNQALCRFAAEYKPPVDYSSPHKNDEFCWNNSLTFNGRPYAVNPEICRQSGQCISQYRIHDGQYNCEDNEDEELVFNKTYCKGNVGRHRFQCFNDEYRCLTPSNLGGGSAVCSNNYDESWYGTGTDIRRQLSCSEDSTTDCHLLKQYIQQSSPTNSTKNSSLVNLQQQEPTDRMPFRDYCNSFWNLDKQFDEIPAWCESWICQNDQYQCQTGQCIKIEWVCDGEWDCSDASDEEAIVLIKKWSVHNTRLSNLPLRVEKCKNRSSKLPFSQVCNSSFEFGCYRSNVSNPLNTTLNRPCINLTQIGDGNEDCYNAYDEKNTFISNSDEGRGMWGFHSRCGNDHIIYSDACNVHNNCTQILCSFSRNCPNPKDFICPEHNYCQENIRCNKKK